MAEENIVENGNLVKIHYTGSFEDGSVFDSSEGKDPLEVLAGRGMLIKGFDQELVGMKVGDEKEIDITPENGYGDRRDDLIRDIPTSELGDEIKPEVGMTLGVKAPTGQVFPAVITDVKDDKIVLDANHPLAGKNLHFKVKVEETRVPTEEDMKKFMPENQGGCSTCSSDSCDTC
ncbi:MAG: FKBP-type peptidyl-prolyl cis-trans isomerase [Nanobdellota archaeon]